MPVRGHSYSGGGPVTGKHTSSGLRGAIFFFSPSTNRADGSDRHRMRLSLFGRSLLDVLPAPFGSAGPTGLCSDTRSLASLSLSRLCRAPALMAHILVDVFFQYRILRPLYGRFFGAYVTNQRGYFNWPSRLRLIWPCALSNPSGLSDFHHRGAGGWTSGPDGLLVPRPAEFGAPFALPHGTIFRRLRSGPDLPWALLECLF